MAVQKILHLLQWQLKAIEEHLPIIKEQGFTAVQISPIQAVKGDTYEWWLLYQNLSYDIGNSQIGTKNDLISLCNEAKKLGIKIYADVLLHNVASNEDGSKMHENVNEELKPYVMDNITECQNYEDRYQTTHLRVGLPLVNYFSGTVQLMHKRFLNELVECGVEGFRVDMLKHFALPSEGCDYLTYVFKEFIDKGIYVYGEVLNAPQHLLNEYSKHMNVLTEWISIDKSKLVTFVISHDEYHSIKNKEWMKKEDILRKWNELINIEKVNAVFFAFPMDDKKGLTNLWKSEEVKNINKGVH